MEHSSQPECAIKVNVLYVVQNQFNNNNNKKLSKLLTFSFCCHYLLIRSYITEAWKEPIAKQSTCE